MLQQLIRDNHISVPVNVTIEENVMVRFFTCISSVYKLPYCPLVGFHMHHVQSFPLGFNKYYMMKIRLGLNIDKAGETCLG